MAVQRLIRGRCQIYGRKPRAAVMRCNNWTACNTSMPAAVTARTLALLVVASVGRYELVRMQVNLYAPEEDPHAGHALHRDPRCANHKVTAYVSADGMAPAVAPFRMQTTSPPPSLRPSRAHGRRSARPSRAVLARAREQPERAHGEWQNPDREEPSRGETPPGLRAHAFRTSGPPAHAFRPRAVMARYFHLRAAARQPETVAH